MPQPVENLVQQNNSMLLLTHSPATGISLTQLRKKNLERLRYFQPSDYSFESFMDMCEVFEPKWFKITSKATGISITYAQTKERAFYGKGRTFPEAYENLMKDIHSSQTADSEQPIA